MAHETLAKPDIRGLATVSRVIEGSGHHRRLAAILVADVVGFSRMVEADEAGTLALLKQRRSEVIEPTVLSHGGRIVKLLGDGVLLEFASAVAAVECAIQLQGKMAEADAGTPGPDRMVLRIGINLGEVVGEGSDIYGEGVNVAARLEAMAPPGGICLSEKVYTEVRGKVDAVFVDLGPRKLKNITIPVKTFGITVAGQPDAAGHPEATAESAPGLPVGPSIAVLPFLNMSGDAAQDYLADGITEDITTALSRLRWLFVIARNSAFTYKGRSVDVRQVARELGVRYVVEGSVRTAAGRIRVTAQLVDAENGKHIWAERYDRALDDIFAVQDDITGRVVAAIEPHLYAEEGFRAASRSPGSIDAWGLVVRAMGLINRVGRRQNEEARALLQRAIEIEPGYARAHALLSWAVWWAALCYWWPDVAEGYRQAAKHAEDAIALDPSEPWARMTLGLSLSTARHHERALAELRAVHDLNPSFALGRTALGWALLRAGRFEEAIAETGKALRMSPMDSFAGIYTAIHGLALLGARRFGDALPFLRASVAAFAEYSGHYNTLISCCGHLGLMQEAQAFIEARNRVGPPIRVGELRRALAGFAHCDTFVEGLVKAGVPE
ncbi:adenylate/guanylate cyclase domain-containing protein [Inquilinus limosus]|uniref:adenylate/guanylate cyclase domain-containing protein n=1 Tax=Inquilinus limosus TaxID=171674 RepID=UPI000407850F|nr:adenylate/guanylate cyclase domain-containing protein [Inquilinus limosus]